LRSRDPDSVLDGGGRALAAALRPLDDERVCVGILAVAMVAATSLSLWLTRGSGFFFDELIFFAADQGLDADSLFSPHNGHLVALPRAVYAVLLDLSGPGYLGFRVLQAAGIALVSAEVYAFSRRRIGPAAALAPSIMLLFLGSAWLITLSPLGLTHVLCVASGLGALICLERGDLRGDLAAAVLLAASLASFSAGLAFLCAGAVYVLLGPDRLHRSWVFGIPLGLYVVWFLASSSLETELSGAITGLRLSNVLLIPGFAIEAAATAVAAITGLSFDFTNAGLGALGPLDPSWGGPLTVVLAVAVAVRMRRGSTTRMLWALLALVATFWASGGMVSDLDRLPDSSRYVYISSVGVLLVLVEAARGARVTKLGLAGLFAILAFALSANLLQARNGGRVLRVYDEGLRAQATGIELARERLEPGFVPEDAPLVILELEAGHLLAGMDRNGYLGYETDDLGELTESQREVFDRTLAGAGGLVLERAAATPGRCAPAPADGARLLPGEALLRAPAGARVAVRRLSAAGVEVGRMPASGAALLAVPPDRAPGNWRVTAPEGEPLVVCSARAPTDGAGDVAPSRSDR
jgi:hypothetical protein